MQDLQGDLAACGVDRIGDDVVFADLPRKTELRRLGVATAGKIRRKTAGDDQGDATAGALGIERSHTLETIFLFFQPGVHRPHQGAIAQRREAEIERGEKVWIRRLYRGLIHELLSGISD